MNTGKGLCRLAGCTVWIVLAILSFQGAAIAQTEPVQNLYFAHYAAGNGFATTLTFVNTGTTTAAGVFQLHDPSGNPGVLNEVSIPPGGVNAFRVAGFSPRIGWVSYEGAGGSVAGIATFEYVETGGTLKSIAGVPASLPLRVATMPVDYDPALDMEAAYAIANPGTETIEILMELFSQDGQLLAAPLLFTLAPGNQRARYVHQDFSSLDRFWGSVVFSSPSGGTFLLMALAQNKGLYTVMPVIASSFHR